MFSIRNLIKVIILIVGLAGSLDLVGSAWSMPADSHGIWVDPPGYIGQCFVCPDNVTSDCLDAEPIYIQIEHDGHARTMHITQLYPVAWSEETGMQYHGTLSMTVQSGNSDEAMVAMTCHWLREDGFGVLIVRQIRLSYTAVDGWQQAEVMHEHDIFECN